MVLHTVNKPGVPLDRCLAACAPGDAVLLIEDGVHAAWGKQATLLSAAACQVHILAEDVARYGNHRPLPEWASPVDYAGFVALVMASDKTQSWY